MSSAAKASPLDRLPDLPARFKPAAMAAAAVALLLGGWLLYQALAPVLGQSSGPDLVAERDRLAQQLSQRSAELRQQFQIVVLESQVQAALAAGDPAAAAARLRAVWPALQDAAFYSGPLDEAYDQAGQTIGFGRLAVLSAARVESEAVLSLVGREPQLAVGLAYALRPAAEAEPQAIGYGELSLATIVDPVLAVKPGQGYLELRGGSSVLARNGDEALRPLAVPVAIAGTPLLIAAANPGGAGGPGVGELVPGGLLVLAGLALLGWSRRGRSTVVATSDEPTLAELAAAKAAPAPAGDVPKQEAPAARPVAVDRSIFRAYDIRGVVGKTLDAHVARLVGQAIGSLLREKGLREIVVGRDGRLSGPQLASALIDGLRSTGCDVIDIGMAPTPVVYFASFQLHTGSCVAITGSHNPPDYNGFKIVVGGDTLSGEAITELYSRIAEDRLQTGAAPGGLQTIDVTRDYIDRIASDVQLERRLRVVVDCGNGVAGAVAPDVLEAIGCEAEPLYCDVDGNFPNHHPDPSEPDNLRDLITAVKRTGADIGLAFDGDGDRLGVVTARGSIIYPDRLLMLFAQDVLSRNPGAAVIYDVKCTGHLAGQILRHGGSPIMWKTGHSLIKAKMKETEAELAGEMSGHFFFRERWFGFDDGVYSAARLLEILAIDDRTPDEIFAELPEGVSTPELKVAMTEGEHYAFIDKFREKARFEGAKIVTIDGVRADWPDGWGLVRCSNTTPSLVLRFDADNEPALKRIQAAFRAQIEAVQPGLALPF